MDKLGVDSIERLTYHAVLWANGSGADPFKLSSYAENGRSEAE